MRKSVVGSWFLVAAVALGVLSCQDDEVLSPDGSSDEAAALVGTQAELNRRPFQTTNDIYAAIAREAPGFGGMFYGEDGDLYIYMTDEGSPEPIQAAVDRHFGPRIYEPLGAGFKAPSVRFLQGRYDAGELKEWRDLFRTVWDEYDLTSLGIKSSENRIRVAVRTAAQRGALARFIVETGIPNDAVSVNVTSPAQLFSAGTLMAGDTVHSNQNCSAGFNALWEGKRVFVTASHCTGEIRRPDGIVFFDGEGVELGAEIEDPWLGGTRKTDAAVIWVSENYPWELGAIGEGGFGRRFSGVALEPFIEGQVLFKRGIATGETSGIFDRYDDALLGGVQIRDGGIVLTGVSFGDSGGPVYENCPIIMNVNDPSANFIEAEMRTCLAGIISGGSQSQGWFIFSPIGLIFDELGHMDVVCSGGPCDEGEGRPGGGSSPPPPPPPGCEPNDPVCCEENPTDPNCEGEELTGGRGTSGSVEARLDELWEEFTLQETP